MTGDIRVNGFPKEQRTFARVTGYVEQSDIHSPQVRSHVLLRLIRGQARCTQRLRWDVGQGRQACILPPAVPRFCCC